MKITVVKIGDKFAVKFETFFNKYFVDNNGDEWFHPANVLKHCLFKTEEEANFIRDLLLQVK